jgi:hypothetical protein
VGEGSSRAKKCKKSDEHGGVHHVFAKVVLPRQKTKDEEEKSENTGDERSFMGRTRKDESTDSKDEIGKSKKKSGVSHRGFLPLGSQEQR